MGVVLYSKCETRTSRNCFVSLGESSGFCFNCVQSPFAFCEVCAVSFATECLARVVAVNSLIFTNISFCLQILFITTEIGYTIKLIPPARQSLMRFAPPIFPLKK